MNFRRKGSHELRRNRYLRGLGTLVAAGALIISCGDRDTDTSSQASLLSIPAVPALAAPEIDPVADTRLPQSPAISFDGLENSYGPPVLVDAYFGPRHMHHACAESSDGLLLESSIDREIYDGYVENARTGFEQAATTRELTDTIGEFFSSMGIDFGYDGENQEIRLNDPVVVNEIDDDVYSTNDLNELLFGNGTKVDDSHGNLEVLREIYHGILDSMEDMSPGEVQGLITTVMFDGDSFPFSIPGYAGQYKIASETGQKQVSMALNTYFHLDNPRGYARFTWDHEILGHGVEFYLTEVLDGESTVFQGSYDTEGRFISDEHAHIGLVPATVGYGRDVLLPEGALFVDGPSPNNVSYRAYGNLNPSEDHADNAGVIAAGGIPLDREVHARSPYALELLQVFACRLAINPDAVGSIYDELAIRHDMTPDERVLLDMYFGVDSKRVAEFIDNNWQLPEFPSSSD
ncbi:MAG: hypothetical protein AAF413_04265 [Patescibacteria group bacterium]